MTGASNALAKSPGATYCFNDICHRVRTIDETVNMVGVIENVTASFYDDPSRDALNPRLETSSGERFDFSAPDNVASPVYPDGTVLLIRAVATGDTAVARVNNAGPYHGNRLLDLSRALAERLGIQSQGVAVVEQTVIAAPAPEETGYQAGRSYRRVVGYLGRFESADIALASLNDTGTFVDSPPNFEAFQRPRLKLASRVGKSVPLRLKSQRSAFLAPQHAHEDANWAAEFASPTRFQR